MIDTHRSCVLQGLCWKFFNKFKKINRGTTTFSGSSE